MLTLQHVQFAYSFLRLRCLQPPRGADLTPCRSRRASAVFVSATYLIYYTNMIMITVKSKCE